MFKQGPPKEVVSQIMDKTKSRPDVRSYRLNKNQPSLKIINDIRWRNMQDRTKYVYWNYILLFITQFQCNIKYTGLVAVFCIPNRAKKSRNNEKKINNKLRLKSFFWS